MRELTDSYRRLRADLLEEGQRRIENLQSSQSRLSAGLDAEQARLSQELRIREQLLRKKVEELSHYLDRFM